MTALVRTFSAAVLLTTALALPALSASAATRGPAGGQLPEPKASTRQLIESCGNLPKTEVIVNSLSQSTDSTSLVDVESSEVFFKVGGTKPTCVLATFAAQAFAPGPFALMRVKALLDGKQSVEGEIQLVAESENFADAHSYNFLFVGVNPGDHLVTMQYRSPNNDEVFINDFNLSVRHR
jgi:hypothetical protein